MCDESILKGQKATATDEQQRHAQEYARLVWRSRRGMLELDMICEPFVREIYRQLEPDLQQAYRSLMQSEDPYLYATLILGKPCLAEHSSIVQRLRNYARSDGFLVRAESTYHS